MKFTKRLLTIALSMSMVMPLCATAYAAKTVTISGATIKANADPDLYDVTVTFTVEESSKQVTLLLTGPNADDKLEDNDIVHINQFGKNVSDEASIIGSGTCTFSVSKARMETAGAMDETTGAINALYVRMGADDADEAMDPVPVIFEASEPETVPVTGVKLNNTTLSLVVGGEGTLVATVEPDNATNKDVTWSSSNTDVATVDANGKVKAVAKGSATITAFVDANENGAFDDGEVSATCAVTVVEASSVIKGDIDGNGTFNYLDVSKLYAYYRGKASLGDDVDKDIDGNGSFNYLDVSKLYAIYRGKANFQ